MPKYIVKHACSDGVTRYMVWSTIVDAPLTFGCSLDEIFAFWREEYGERGVEALRRSLEASGFDHLDAVIGGNRAGRDETRLTGLALLLPNRRWAHINQQRCTFFDSVEGS